MWVLAIAAVTGATATLAWLADRRRFRTRNERGQCASCGVEWHRMPDDDPYLMHGRLICGRCAARAKVRMVCHFGVLAVSTAVASGLILAGKGLVAMVFFPLAATVAMTYGAVHLMKLSNRDAQRLIARGQSADFRALASWADGEPTALSKEGIARRGSPASGSPT